MASHKIPIYSPRFVGKRFEDHTLPLELLEDVAALEDLTIEVAKWAYLERNEGRQRVPRGFTDGVSIRLESIEQGSTQLKIAMFVLSANLFPPAHAEFFKEASERVVKAIQAAEDNDSITAHIPDKYLSYFNRIGKKLHDEESIEFTPSKDNKARLTKASRKRLILASSGVKEYTEEIVIRGYINELDKLKNTFQVQMIDGLKISGSFDEEYKLDLQEALVRYEDHQLIKIQGIGKFNRADKLESIESIESVELLEDLDVPSRLQELSRLEDGWLNGEGKHLAKIGIAKFSELFEIWYSPHLPLPHIFPTPDGNIQAELSSKTYELSLYISLDDLVANLHILNVIDDSEFLSDLDLNKHESWQTLNEQISKIYAD